VIRLKDLLTEAVDPKFEKRANEFLKRLQSMLDKHYKEKFPGQERKVTFDKGRRYWRVRSTGVGKITSPSPHVHNFLDTTNGDVLKAAGWRAPAKHARANIFDNDYGMSGVGEYGAKYLR